MTKTWVVPLLVVWPLAVFGQSSPESVASDYLDIVASSGFAAAFVTYIHPDDVMELKREMVRVFSRRPAYDVEDVFGYATTVDELAEMEPGEFFQKLFDYLPSEFSLTQPLDFSSEVIVLGIVPEGELRHIVTRLRSGDASQVDVVTAKPYGDDWKLVPPGDVMELLGLVEDILDAGF